MTKAQELKYGQELILNNTPLFRTSTYPSSHRSLTGKYFLYDGKAENGRVKIVESKSAVRFKPEEMVFIGWVSVDNIPKQIKE